MLNNKTCPWCGQKCPNYNTEHIIPKSWGAGKIYNTMKAHSRCNHDRDCDFAIPSLENRNTFYKHFNDIQLKYVIRAIYYWSDVILENYESRIRINKEMIEHYSDDPEERYVATVRYWEHEISLIQKELDNLNNLKTAIETKGEDPMLWLFDEI